MSCTLYVRAPFTQVSEPLVSQRLPSCQWHFPPFCKPRSRVSATYCIFQRPVKRLRRGYLDHHRDTSRNLVRWIHSDGSPLSAAQGVAANNSHVSEAFVQSVFYGRAFSHLEIPTPLSLGIFTLVLRAGAPADVLTASSVRAEQSSQLYADYNHLKDFVLAFPVPESSRLKRHHLVYQALQHWGFLHVGFEYGCLGLWLGPLSCLVYPRRRGRTPIAQQVQGDR